MKTVYRIFLLAFTGGVLSLSTLIIPLFAGPMQQEVVLGKDEINVFPPSQKKMISGFEDHDNQDIKDRFETGDITTKILDINNISGHNPLNTDDPILNFNGSVFDTPEDLKDCVDNNNCNTSSSSSDNTFGGCGASKMIGAKLEGGLFLFKNGSTGDCEHGLKISVSDPDPVAPAGKTEAFTILNPAFGSQALNTVRLKTKAGSGFTLSTPPAGATPLTVTSWAVTPGTYTMVVKHTPTGNQWQYKLTFIGEAPTYTDPIPPNTVYNFTKVGWTILTRGKL
mgnify:CR=1 FL=1